MATYFHRIDTSRVYTVAEAKDILGCSDETVRQKIKSKKLVASRVDRGPWLISGESLKRIYGSVEAMSPVAVIPTKRQLNKIAFDLLLDK